MTYTGELDLFSSQSKDKEMETIARIAGVLFSLLISLSVINDGPLDSENKVIILLLCLICIIISVREYSKSPKSPQSLGKGSASTPKEESDAFPINLRN